MPGTKATPPEVRLEDLRDATAAELRVLWMQIRGESPPLSLSGRLLRLGLAWDLQAVRGEGESAADRRVWAAVEARRASGTPPLAAMIGAGPGGPRAGTRLLRSWGGETHEVFVREGAVEWNGRRYGSLSAVARAITGSRRNGPRFFGLREEGRG